MKSVLQRIEIRNFKAFRNFSLDVGGRHLLVYGANGSGKSSLYWAIYTFLQSGRKESISKYFDPADDQRLLNIHEDANSNPGEIAMTLLDPRTKTETKYRINRADHGTKRNPTITKGELASDFITYRFFFGFSDFRNSQRFDLWPLFEKEILPFCRSTSGRNPEEAWNDIKSGQPNPWGERGLAGANNFDNFRYRTNEFAQMLDPIVKSINERAQKFYDEHFSAGDPAKVLLSLKLTQPPSFTGTNQDTRDFKKPIIEFGVRLASHTITRPQSFLNEAKLTQLALSVRFAASLVNLHQSDLKLLVLDDLLVSLDMSNRMKVVEILLSETFADYQKIILTHELGFYREFRRTVGAAHTDWCFLQLEGSPNEVITCKSEKTETQKAEEYIRGHNLDEAALCLRKAVEDTAKRFIDHTDVLPTKEFLGLADALRNARNRILGELPVELYEKVLRNTPHEHRALLVASNDEDLESNQSLDPATRGRLKTNRNRLRLLATIEHVERLRRIKLIDDILACTERVLNPAAHAGSPPLYEKEVEDALALVVQLEQALQ